MKKTDPEAPKGRENSSTETNGFNRDDSARGKKSGTVPFAKDKRVRINRVEKNAPGSRDDKDKYPAKPSPGERERNSYNPNFTRDNRKRDDGRGTDRSYGGKKEGNRPERGGSGYGGKRDESRPPREDRRESRDSYKGRYEKPGNRDQRDEESNPGLYDKPRAANRSDKPRFGAKPRRERITPNLNEHGFNRDGSYPSFPAPELKDEIRLNRYIAASGISSRREADEFIKKGLVKVNGEVVTEMGAKIQPGDVVEYDGKTIQNEKKVYIVMNKPKGYVTTIEDPHADKTVMDLLKGSFMERVYPVGRLDKNSLGILLITNDGDLTKHLTHPSYNKKKIYHATLDKAVSKADLEQLTMGITLDDGEIHADEASYVGTGRKEVGIEIHSGRNRIIRRMFEHLGYKVTKLDRVYFAGLTKKNLKRGAWRFLTKSEVDMLKSGKYE